MSARFAASFIGSVAALLAVVGLATGPVAALLAGPLAFLLGVLALRVGHGVDRDTARYLVGAGFLAGVLGVGFAVFGSPWGGLALAGAGVAVGACGAQFALEFDRPPRGHALPATADPALTAAVAVDEGTLLFWELQRFGRRLSGAERIAADVRAAADRNHERGWADRPEHAHPLPPPLEKPILVTENVARAGWLEHLTFASEFEPQDPEVADLYQGFRHNRTAHVYLKRRLDGPRPTLLLVHGYTMGRVGCDVGFWDVSWLHGELGIDVALVTLPLHGPRAPGRRSGEHFLDGHPLVANAALGQAIWELRRVAGWLRSEGAPALGIAGYSMGGYTAALFASLHEGLACAVPVMPVSDVADLVWGVLPPARRAERKAVGLAPHQLREAYARHSPLRVRPKVSHEARLVVGGLADRIVAPAQVNALWEHWGAPEAVWLPGTHLVWRDKAAYRDAFAAHVRRTLLAEEPS